MIISAASYPKNAYALLIFAFFFSVPRNIHAQAPYRNPVVGDPNHVDPDLADPFVLKWNGEYFLYTSGSPITAYHSTDLVHWDFVGPVLRASEAPEAWNQADVWAPEVVYRNGKFYLYYTASRKSDDWRVGEMARRIGVAVSENPRGPFVDLGQPVTPGWGIDATVFKDPDGGAEYLFYSYLYEPRLPGAGIVADRLTAWNSVAGHPAHITRGSEAWEDKDGDPNDGSVRYTNEAPTVLKHHGRYYMMYSGGSWDLPTYALGYATSETLPEGGLSGPGWKKIIPPILRSTPLVDAPGHNAMTKAPNNVDDICIYHARVIPFLDPWNRLPFVDRLYWNHDRMFMEQPSLRDLPVPDQPVFSIRGAADALASDFRKGKTLQTVSKTGHYSDFIYEVNLRTVPSESGSRPSAKNEAAVGAGAIVFQKDENNQIRVSIEPSMIALRGKLDGKEIMDLSQPLPADFEPDAFHQLLITRNEDRFDVNLDGVQMLSGSFPLRGQQTGVGIFSLKSPVEFGYQALTAFYNDSFVAPAAAAAWHQTSGTWLVREGALHQVTGGPGRSIALKGDPTENYEFSASVLWEDSDSLPSKAGIVAAASESGELVLAGFDRNIWPFARFWVQHVSSGEARESFAMGLPRGFQYDVYHTVRMVKQGSSFTFFLDGKEIAAERFSISVARPGLYTEAARAAFDDVSMKHLVVAQNLILNPGFETEQWDGARATKDNPWTLSGSARANDCCAHSGQRRVVLSGGEGAARQVIPNLSPGRYHLHAWVISRGTEAHLSVSDFGAAQIQVPARGERWQHAAIDFSIPEDHSSVTIQFDAKVPAEPGNYAAADDFYLYKE
ncbi:MAG TPA: family 43 glycosylhydrolase [Candidatus Dormibacteraeota bacterium]|nr:family 43 glycosylhydrolase [Candidatus Dormibacteraeota bacterium]